MHIVITNRGLNTMKNIFKQICSGIALTTTAVCSPIQVTKGFCALEQIAWYNQPTAPYENRLENRLYVNAKLSMPQVTVGIYSFNTISNDNNNSYFGSQQLSVGTDVVRALGEIQLIRGSKPSFATGFRIDSGLPQSTYGYTTLSFGQTASRFQSTSGYSFRWCAFELTGVVTKTKNHPYSESLESQVVFEKQKVSPFIIGRIETTGNVYGGLGIRANF